MSRINGKRERERLLFRVGEVQACMSAISDRAFVSSPFTFDAIRYPSFQSSNNNIRTSTREHQNGQTTAHHID